jgi:hypothetical protein
MLEHRYTWGASAPAETGVMSWMQVPYGEGVASHTGPESCAVAREGGGEALTGVRSGRVLSREIQRLQAADAVGSGGRPHPERRHRETHREPARSETPSTHGNITHGSRETPRPPVGEGPTGRTGKSKDTRR